MDVYIFSTHWVSSGTHQSEYCTSLQQTSPSSCHICRAPVCLKPGFLHTLAMLWK